MSEQPLSERSIFESALDQGSPEERAAYLERACGGNEGLRREVEALLAAHDRLGGILPEARATGPPAGGNELPANARPGTMIGPYKLLQQIGEGGMGTVWLAEQAQPVQRRVALKLIKAGTGSEQVVARFEAERQALALMDHPNIAKVFDGGTTASGRPYFVMELVKGVPITKYCDEHRLTPRQRLELFVPVCAAVQHAHQKGIIHRDLKPSNVLVCLYDGKPVPKVIDFGVAKATGQKLTEKTLFTELGSVVGTLEYMSPEQAELNQLDIDTRSDIYSLGVLLYELLTGTTPLERKRFKEVAFLEVLRLIREEESQRPSTRLSTTEGLPSIAANRGLEPKKLSGLVRGELDWIVMKCLDKDRNRRYESASAFAADVQRYLNDEAVQACPPSAWYRFRKLARRNKTRLAITGLILFFLVVLGGGSGWALRDRAAREEEVLRDRAARQAVVEERVTQALGEAAERQAQGKWTEALAAARRAEELLAAGGSDELRRQARQLRADLERVAQLADIRLQSTAVKDGNFDVALRDPAYAQVFREYGLDLARGVGGAEAVQRIRATSIGVELAAALDDWALVCRVTRPRADTTWKELLAIARAADPDPFRNQLRDAWERREVKALEQLAASEKAADLPAPTVLLLGDALADTGAIQAGVDLLRRAQLRHPADFWINHSLAYALARMQPPQLDEAIGYYRAALALRPESPGVYVNLGGALRSQGRLDEAVAEYQEAIRIKKDYAGTHYALGIAFHGKGQLDEAIAAYQEAIRLKKDFAEAHYNLGSVLKEKGKGDEAIAEYQKAIRLKPDDAKAHCNLGIAWYAKGKVDEAIAEFQEAIRLKKDLPNAHNSLGAAWHAKGRLDDAIAELQEAIALKPDFAAAHTNLGHVLKDKGQLDEAIARFQEAIRLKPDLHEAHFSLGEAWREKGRLDEAITEYKEAIRLKKDFAEAHSNLGTALLQKNRLKEAIVELREAIRLKKDSPEAHNSLGTALYNKGRPDEAMSEFLKAIRLKKDYADAHYNLGNALRSQGRLDEAIAAYREAIRLKKDDAEAHCNLGNALRDKGRLDEAIAAFEEAIRLEKDFALAHYNLGNVLRDKGRLDDAIAEYQEAIRIKKDYAEAHCNLGHAHLSKGQFAQALTCLRRGHELGSRSPRWPYPSAQWARNAERLVALDDKLPVVLSGKVQPADTAERLALAQFCQKHKKRYAAAARFYAEAFAAGPKLVGDQPSGLRYDAACAAALAGCAQGEDAKSLDEQERARLRHQALDWLRADLAGWRGLLEKGPAKAGPALGQQMQHWLNAPDFAGARGAEALGRLPAVERPDWQKLWQEVEELRQRAAAPAGAASSGRPSKP